MNVDEIDYGCYYWAGSRNTSSTYNASPLIAVEPEQKLWLQSGTTTRVNRKMYFVDTYDLNKKSVGSYRDFTNGYVVPDGVAFVIISALASQMSSAELSAVIVSEDGSPVEYEPWVEPISKKTLKAEHHDDDHIQGIVDHFVNE